MKKQNPVQKGSIIAAWGLVALLGGYVCIRMVDTKPSLLAKATPLHVGQDWVQSYGGYFWESDHAVLAFRALNSGLEAVSVDVVAKTTTPLTRLSKEIKYAFPGNIGNWRLSQDGKRLLWWSRAPTKQGAEKWYVSDLDGKRISAIDVVRGGNTGFWEQGGADWLELRTNFGVTPVLHRKNGKEESLSPIAEQLDFAFAYSPDNRILAIIQADRKGVFGWREYGIKQSPTQVTDRRLKIPEACTTVTEAELSPDGDQIACLFTSPQRNAFSGVFQRFLPNSEGSSAQHSELWVFSRDGAKRHLIGVENGVFITGILWTQDSKSISLLGGGKLYKVSPES